MRVLLLVSLCLFLFSCQQQTTEKIELNKAMQTYSNYEQVKTTKLSWKYKVDFEKKEISGTAIWSFKNLSKAKNIIFDTYDLTIEKVLVDNKEVKYSLSKLDEVYGSGLLIPIHENDSVVIIQYHTGAKATALQWLAPSQTAGKKLPYLFTQCESIYARSLVPCQDVPAIRISYEADAEVPVGMMAVMSAENPTVQNKEGKYHFNMDIPIPTYLIALAVGDISYQPIDSRSGVYTETCMLQETAKELSDIPNMMKAAEELGGPYKWGKYDVLVAPPSFPIGGMENPKLTFATPTIIAGDKSLVSLIAHEMAHSWSGNLVTNATWDDIWLNEGFTTYFERRIMEKISGKSYNDMLWELGYQDLQSDLKDLGNDHPDTRLRIELQGRHPEEAFTNIPYEKGAVFLRMLEENVGREKFDPFINTYFQSHAFIPMTTKACLDFMDQTLFKDDTSLKATLKINEWVYEPGLPDNCPHTFPERFKQVNEAVSKFENGGKANEIQTKNWSTHEWLQMLRKLSHPLLVEKMKDLDQQFKFTGIGNCEIADEWYKLAINSNYEAAYPAMEVFLSKVGRKKFLEPLYSAMMNTDKGKLMAKSIFEKSKENYHPQTASKINKLIQGK
ncbi:MAG: M1 family metallopeptidase [Chitinophagaceae bacterium]|nr:M1 family metallopeptidase [Chitinophagaceae bacterium]